MPGALWGAALFRGCPSITFTDYSLKLSDPINHGVKKAVMIYYVFQVMCEVGMPGHFNGLTKEVVIPGKDYSEAERNARTMLGERYRGATTVPVTEVLLVRL